MGLRIVRVADAAAVARTAADLVVGSVARRPASFVAATGTTPMATYAELARRARRGAFDASSLHAFQLDEYVGVARSDRRSLTGWFDRSVVDPLGIDDDRAVRFDGLASDLDGACRRYDDAVARNPFDLAILGLGPNGHLGFNEPPSTADAPTRVVTLTPQSVRSNAAYWGSEADVPRRAVTAGMAQLLSARRVMLLVVGPHKREILRAVVDGPVTDDVPASHLQLHADAIVVADADALGPDPADRRR
ncbi:MAG TPA: glucosamine-6-phosphate deaminase [Actinomycetota bacterium]|nr:glucosamine-6-phosphate deaminase [Actinomycetota bacterium]